MLKYGAPGGPIRNVLRLHDGDLVIWQVRPVGRTVMRDDVLLTYRQHIVQRTLLATDDKLEGCRNDRKVQDVGFGDLGVAELEDELGFIRAQPEPAPHLWIVFLIKDWKSIVEGREG